MDTFSFSLEAWTWLKIPFSLQDERNDKVLDKERRFQEQWGEGGGEVEKSFWRNSSATSVWVLKNKFALSSELKWKKATGKKN